jgi:mycofactocin biosynthesis protein MftB
MSAETTIEGRWRLHPKVALRPERFGALAYHFGTRRLSFLKSRRLLAVVEGLEGAADAEAACRAAGVPDDELPSYRQALATLAETGMIVPATPPGAPACGAFLPDSGRKAPQELAA